MQFVDYVYFDDDGEGLFDFCCGNYCYIGCDYVVVLQVFDVVLYGWGGQVYGFGDFVLWQGVVLLQQVEDGVVEVVEYGGGGYGEQKLYEQVVN